MDMLVSEPHSGTKTRSNNRRAAILDAAAYRFRRQGYAATTMREVASDADMLAGSMYYHFSSKDALLLAVHQEGDASVNVILVAESVMPEASVVEKAPTS